MFGTVQAAFGRIGIVVANAGLQKDAAIADMTLEQWRCVLGVNLTGQLQCVREALRRFMAQGLAPISRARGKIVCMNPVHQQTPWGGHVNYTASRRCVTMLMQSVSRKVAGQGLLINSIAPGAIKTGLNDDAWSMPEAREKRLKLMLYRRSGEPDDVARTAVWLACDEADYVTGTTLLVDGGMRLYPGFHDIG